jgi:hypothetical protein
MGNRNRGGGRHNLGRPKERMIISWKSPFKLARSIYLSIYGRLTGTPILVEHRIQKVRIHWCKYCEFNVNEQCSKCTCFIDAKTWLSMESCPEGKWRKIVKR